MARKPIVAVKSSRLQQWNKSDVSKGFGLPTVYAGKSVLAQGEECEKLFASEDERLIINKLVSIISVLLWLFTGIRQVR